MCREPNTNSNWLLKTSLVSTENTAAIFMSIEVETLPGFAVT